MPDLNQLLFQCQTGKCSKEEVIAAILEKRRLYLIADAGTTEEQFASKKFAFHVSEGKALLVYIEEEYAAKKAEALGSTLRKGEPMTVSSTKQALATLVNTYVASGRIKSVCFCGKPPFRVEVSAHNLFPEAAPQEKRGETETVELSMPVATKGVDGLKKMLDCNDRSKIAQLPTYSFFENFPQLMAKLIQVNRCDPALMDEALGIPEGLTHKVISDPKADISTDVLKKYLAYFGLDEYLYRYASNCQELASSLKRSPSICKFDIKTANGSTEEPFVLKDIKRQKDKNGAWLYQLTFENELRTVKCVVVSPLGMIVGKRYELGGLKPQLPEEDHSAGGRAPMPTPEKGDEILRRLKEKQEKEQRSYEQVRRDQVISFFKRQNKEGRILQLKEAERYYEKLAKYDDLLDEFFWTNCCPKSVMERLEGEPEYQRRRANQPSPIKIKDYTAAKLQKEFKIPVYDVYFEMIELKNAPVKTMERLRYRLTDPQYQKQ